MNKIEVMCTFLHHCLDYPEKCSSCSNNLTIKVSHYVKLKGEPEHWKR